MVSRWTLAIRFARCSAQCSGDYTETQVAVLYLVWVRRYPFMARTARLARSLPHRLVRGQLYPGHIPLHPVNLRYPSRQARVDACHVAHVGLRGAETALLAAAAAAAVRIPMPMVVPEQWVSQGGGRWRACVVRGLLVLKMLSVRLGRKLG